MLCFWQFSNALCQQTQCSHVYVLIYSPSSLFSYNFQVARVSTPQAGQPQELPLRTRQLLILLILWHFPKLNKI